MPAVRTLAILLFAACGGCGGSWSSSFEVGDCKKLSVGAWKGTVKLRNGAPGKVEVSVRGASVPVILGETQGASGDCTTLRVDQAARDVPLTLEIAAPPGISLSVGCSDADVEVSGAWGELAIATDGAVDARVDAGRGTLTGRRGGVSYVALRPGPAGEMRVESASGDVSVALPAAWRGQLKFQTQTGRLDVPTHKSLQTIWDEDRKGVVGRMGPPHGKGAPLSTVWGVSGTGDVSFRVGE